MISECYPCPAYAVTYVLTTLQRQLRPTGRELVSFGDPVDAVRDEFAEVGVVVAAVADDGAEDAGFVLGAIPGEPLIGVFEERGGVVEHVHVGIEFVVQDEMFRQAGGDGMLCDDGDGDVDIAFVGGGGDAVDHLFVLINVSAAGDVFVFAPHRVGEIGVVEDDDSDAFLEQFQEADFLFVGHLGRRIVEQDDVVAVKVGAVVGFGVGMLLGPGVGDFGVILEHLEEGIGFEAVAAGQDEDVDFFIGVGGRFG